MPSTQTIQPAEPAQTPPTTGPGGGPSNGPATGPGGPPLNGPATRGGRTGARAKLPRVGAIVAVGLAVLVGAWLVLRDDDGGSGTAGASGPTVMSLEELQSLAASKNHPVYWAGPVRGMRYEVTHSPNGPIYVRYLPPGAEVGDPRPRYLAVATYPLSNGYARVMAAAKEERTTMTKLPSGGRAVVDADRPSSVYLAYPGGKYQVEVYEPSPDRAHDLVVSGAVQPVR